MSTDRLGQIKTKIERAKTYGLEPTVTLADIEWLIAQAEGWHREVTLRMKREDDAYPWPQRYKGGE